MKHKQQALIIYQIHYFLHFGQPASKTVMKFYFCGSNQHYGVLLWQLEESNTEDNKIGLLVHKANTVTYDWFVGIIWKWMFIMVASSELDMCASNHYVIPSHTCHLILYYRLRPNSDTLSGLHIRKYYTFNWRIIFPSSE